VRKLFPLRLWLEPLGERERNQFSQVSTCHEFNECNDCACSLQGIPELQQLNTHSMRAFMCRAFCLFKEKKETPNTLALKRAPFSEETHQRPRSAPTRPGPQTSPTKDAANPGTRDTRESVGPCRSPHLFPYPPCPQQAPRAAPMKSVVVWGAPKVKPSLPQVGQGGKEETTRRYGLALLIPPIPNLYQGERHL
jgi:hypothetical protein